MKAKKKKEREAAMTGREAVRTEEGTVLVGPEKQKVKVKPKKHNCSNNRIKMIHTSTPFEQSKCIPDVLCMLPTCLPV